VLVRCQYLYSMRGYTEADFASARQIECASYGDIPGLLVTCMESRLGLEKRLRNRLARTYPEDHCLRWSTRATGGTSAHHSGSIYVSPWNPSNTGEIASKLG